VWSFHYYGFVDIVEREPGGWVVVRQYSDTAWFNPPSAGVDIAVDGNRDAHIVANPKWDLFYYACSLSSASLEEIPYRLDDYSIAANSESVPMISYVINDELKLAVRESSAWSTSTVGEAIGCGKTDLVIDSDDVPHVVFCRRIDSTTKVVYAVRPVPAGPWEFHVVGEGTYPSLAVELDGRLHVCYRWPVISPADWTLRYATTATDVPVRETSWGELKSLLGRQGNDKRE
jgi:hypothetical protein